MRIGRLRHKITIQSVTETRSSTGAVVDTWGTFAAVWASIDPIIGKEYFAAKQVMAEVTHNIRLRYIAGVTPKMRILFGARVFNIQGIINVAERNQEIVIMAAESI